MAVKGIYDYSRERLEAYFLEKKLAKFRATQIFEALYRIRISAFSQITNIKKEVIAQLEQDFTFPKLEIVTKNVARDGTTKFLFRLEDQSLIETVLMIHDYGYSVCVTSQVGCNMGCAFCASGMTKRIRNLTPAEMVLQVLTIDNYLRQEEKRVSHVVIMGIGEPFDNYDNVIEFIKIINDPKGLEIGARHITLSTCGIVPKIYEFAELSLQVNLAISLHFANDEKRSRYMKINKKYPLKALITALKDYFQKTKRRITFEYILLKGINDSLEDAKELCDLIRGLNCYVNLIPYNETGGIFKRSDEKVRDQFFDYLIKNKINAIIRKEHGHDINAACGQLRVQKMKEK
ncbi:MAG TPA: 23S rRNA (adenine(2503)-C(2))-methyltransferase RlmN [Bacilli bacterium]|nr:23S rRNA (adenine(2503)-C(2))-methyltransferase RlmN [Bacilli bacterium]